MNTKRIFYGFVILLLSGSGIVHADEGTKTAKDGRFEFAVAAWAEYTDNRDSTEDEENNLDLGITPSIAWDYADWQRTFLSFKYALTYRWRENPADYQNSDEWLHRVRASITHYTTPRLTLMLSDLFSYTDDPAVDGKAVDVVGRDDNSYYYNVISAGSKYLLTPRSSFDFKVDYTIKRYDDDDVADTSDRDTWRVYLKLRRQQTANVGIYADYTWKRWLYDESLDFSRDYDAHYLGAGFDYDITPAISIDVHGGYQRVIYDDDSVDDVDNPYFGVTFMDRLTRFIVLTLETTYSIDNTDAYPYSGEETLRFYGRLDWRVAQDFSVGVTADYRREKYELDHVSDDTDAADFVKDTSGDADRIYASVFARYRWNDYALTLRQSFDKRDSDVNESYTRNATYIGVSRTF